MSQTDKDLVRRACQGDSQALGLLVDRHSSSLYRLALSLVNQPHDAQDLVQDTWLGALRHLGHFQGRASVRTWLSRILMKQAANHWRRQSYRRTQTLDQPDPAAGSDPRLTTDPGVAQSDARLDLMDLLETLSPEHRVVLVLRELEGLSYEQISQALELPPGTIESRLFRARQALKQSVESATLRQPNAPRKDEVRRG